MLEFLKTFTMPRAKKVATEEVAKTDVCANCNDSGRACAVCKKGRDQEDVVL